MPLVYRILIFMLCSTLVQAQSLRVGIEDNSPPKWIVKANQPVTGFCPDLLRLLQATDPVLRFQFPRGAQPQKRIEYDVTIKQLDLLCGLTRNAQRDAVYQYIGAPIYSMDYVLVARSNDLVAPKSWNDVRLLGDQGIILLNYDSSAIVTLTQSGGLRLDHSGLNIETNLKKLHNQRGRFFYYHAPGVRAEMRRLGVTHQFRIIEPALETLPFYLLAGQHVTQEQILRLQAAIARIETNGSLNALRNKWF